EAASPPLSLVACTRRDVASTQLKTGAGRDSLITETLSAAQSAETADLTAVLISDSALKVVLSYYPVCRCQRTSILTHIQTQKNSILSPGRSAFAKATADKRGQN